MADEATQPENSSPGMDVSHLLLVVVGAHLRAEIGDRPLAYRLCERIRNWLEKHGRDLNVPLIPIVCTDIWYLNHEELHRRPTIGLGGPGVNALSAYYAQKLPAALVQEDRMVIQLDPEFVDLRACVWGMNHDLTVQGLDLFVSKYLDGYLRAAATQVEPSE